MTESHNHVSPFFETVELAQPRLVNVNHIKTVYELPVAPEAPVQKDEFHSLSLAERQVLLQKLINRVKAL